jgi:hypothetical protein
MAKCVLPDDGDTLIEAIRTRDDAEELPERIGATGFEL